MSDLVIQPTSTAQWHALVSEAEHASDCILCEDTESYLVFLLMKFSNNPQMAARVLAIDYLTQCGTDTRPRLEQLQEIGDHCLLFSGLFPSHAERRMVKVSYFVELGRSAYSQMSSVAHDSSAELYSHLSENFVSIMDIMQTMRALRSTKSDISPIHAYDLWKETGSKHALKIIQAVTNGHPVCDDQKDAEEENNEIKILH